MPVSMNFGISLQIVRKMIAASRLRNQEDLLLRQLGLSSVELAAASPEVMVAADAFYNLIEQLTATGDDSLPFRFARIVAPEDFAAMEEACEQALTAQGVIESIARYFLMLTHPFTYEFRLSGLSETMVLRTDGDHRAGACVAREAVLAAIVSCLRQIAPHNTLLNAVSFCHIPPLGMQDHQQFFNCPVSFGAASNALFFSPDLLQRELRSERPAVRFTS